MSHLTVLQNNLNNSEQVKHNHRSLNLSKEQFKPIQLNQSNRNKQSYIEGAQFIIQNPKADFFLPSYETQNQLKNQQNPQLGLRNFQQKHLRNNNISKQLILLNQELQRIFHHFQLYFSKLQDISKTPKMQSQINMFHDLSDFFHIESFQDLQIKLQKLKVIEYQYVCCCKEQYFKECFCDCAQLLLIFASCGIFTCLLCTLYPDNHCDRWWMDWCCYKQKNIYSKSEITQQENKCTCCYRLTKLCTSIQQSCTSCVCSINISKCRCCQFWDNNCCCYVNFNSYRVVQSLLKQYHKHLKKLSKQNQFHKKVKG